MKNKFLRYIFYSLLICGLISFIIPDPDINDLEKYRLKGNVKSVMEIKYSLTGKEANAAKDKIIFQKYTLFDPNGYETESVLYNNGEQFLLSKIFTGPDGKPVEMSEYKPDGTLNLHVTYNYDDKVNKSEAVYDWKEDHKVGEICENTDYYYEVIQNEIFTKVLYKNEYRGFCTEENYMKADGSLSFRFTAKYDINGNKLEMGYFHGNGRLSWLTKFDYDRYNNLVESRLFKSNRIAVYTMYEYQFDEVGNWVVRREKREVHVNILTAGLDRNDMVTERNIEYY
jgi:hypothetical protein